MRLAILSCLLLTTMSASVGSADDAADRERKVRVALALAGSAQCGQCQFDEDKCRAEAAAANKPLVLFVGPACGKYGAAAIQAGAVACVVESYDKDGRLPESPRAVVLSPRPGGGFWLEGTVLNPTAETLKAAIEKARPKAVPAPPATPAPRATLLDWSS